MSAPDVDTLARQWLAAFNAHDLEAVLALFHDDVVFSSPLAARTLPETGGVLHGKDALREYWQQALLAVPDLHFELVGVYAGVDSVVLHHRNQRGGLVCDVLLLDGGLVRSGHAAYLQPG